VSPRDRHLGGALRAALLAAAGAACATHAPGPRSDDPEWCLRDHGAPGVAVSPPERGLTPPQKTLPALALAVAGHPFAAEVADEPHERERGLMGRTAMGADAGMLFVYPDTAPRAFYMRHTLLPLSIAYLDPTGTVVHLADMRPLCEDLVPSDAPATFALEAHRGWFAAHGVRVGDRVTLASGAPLPAPDPGPEP
jgi:uncharacterized membrane protein (UPF0127 family)